MIFETNPLHLWMNFTHFVFNNNDPVNLWHLLKELLELHIVFICYPILSVLAFLVQSFRFFYQLTKKGLQPHSVCITGASTGLGRALAREVIVHWLRNAYIARDRKESDTTLTVNSPKTLTLVSRNRSKLEKVQQELMKIIAESEGVLREDSVQIIVRECDICNEQVIESIVTEVDYDLLICGAATNSQILAREMQVDQKGMTSTSASDVVIDEEDVIWKEFQVNINGTLNTVIPALKQAKKLRNPQIHSPKQIAIISSSVGYFGKLMGPYGITKTFLFEFFRLMDFIIESTSMNGIQLLTESSSENVRVFREWTRKYANSNQVSFHVITPAGVIDTKMGESIRNIENIPGSIYSTDAARRIFNGLIQGQKVIDLSNPWVYCGFRLMNALPLSAESLLTRVFQLELYS
ncbi:hypothetical protein C9374_002576 [Naegleria lovaniensis]|uniref:Uncharacterized protein n=1 Tax=Naegleria lovaniensis TaxID=51637 RepID=A0AA88GSN3_NAELO|nr:uncharacterized protein C9374_002576 [Naegleria lovaniensis]KAG2386130.1 hypothetical protein C9374_002576 [Naegleria lovaniensis]